MCKKLNIDIFVKLIIKDLKNQNNWFEYVNSLQFQQSIFFSQIEKYIEDKARGYIEEFSLNELARLFDTMDLEGVDVNGIDSVFDVYNEGGDISCFLEYLEATLVNVLTMKIIYSINKIAVNVSEEELDR